MAAGCYTGRTMRRTDQRMRCVNGALRGAFGTVSKTIAVTLVAGVLISWPAAAGILEEGVPYFANYDPKAANPAIGYQNWAATQDSRGLMYFGNTSGVVEYDGVSWRLLSLPGRSTARSLARGADGRIYVGGQGIIGFLDEGPLGRLQYRSLTELVPEEDQHFADVWKTHGGVDGIYFQTYSHLFRWDGESIDVWRPRSSFHFSFLVGSTLYILEEGAGLLRLEGDDLVPVPGGRAFAADRVYAMMEFGDGQILVGTRDRGLFVLGSEGAVPWQTEADAYLIANQLYHGTTLADGTFAMATLRGGVVLLDRQGRVRQILDRTLGIQDSTVTFVFVDDRQGLWLTLDRNLARVGIPASITVFGERQGLHGAVQALRRHRGRLYVRQPRVSIASGARRHSRNAPSALPDSNPWTGSQPRAGR